MADLRVAKQFVQKHFKTSGIQLNPAALEHLARLATEEDDPEELVLAVIDEIETGEAPPPAASPPASRQPPVRTAHRRGRRPTAQVRQPTVRPVRPCAIATDERRVSLELLQHALGTVQGRAGHHAQDFIQVVDAFELPVVAYDPIRKAFHRSDYRPQVLGDAKVPRAGRPGARQQPGIAPAPPRAPRWPAADLASPRLPSRWYCRARCSCTWSGTTWYCSASSATRSSAPPSLPRSPAAEAQSARCAAMPAARAPPPPSCFACCPFAVRVGRPHARHQGSQGRAGAPPGFTPVAALYLTPATPPSPRLAAGGIPTTPHTPRPLPPGSPAD